MSKNKRSVLQATYTPIDLSKIVDPKGGDAEIKASALAQVVYRAVSIVKPKPEELMMVLAPNECMFFVEQNGKESAAPQIRPLKELVVAISPERIIEALSDIVKERELLFKEKSYSKACLAKLLKFIEANSVDVVDVDALAKEVLNKINVAIAETARKGKVDDSSTTQYFAYMNAAMAASINHLTFAPIGYLHLEKLNFEPKGVTRGELVNSIPLAPSEEIHVTHKVWSNHSEDFEKLISQFKEENEELGVSEKSELASSVKINSQESTAFNTSVTASGSYGTVSVTAVAGFSANTSESKSADRSAKNSSELTNKASSRVKREHKVTFRTSSSSGEESESSKLIKNPFGNKVARIDYFRMIREWEVTLERYGVRLTWDMTVPAPGADLLDKVKEISSIREELSQGFDVYFDVDFTGMDVNAINSTAANWNIALTHQLPVEEMRVVKSLSLYDPPSYHDVVEIIDIDPLYEVKDADTIGTYSEQKKAGLPSNGAGSGWGIVINDAQTLSGNPANSPGGAPLFARSGGELGNGTPVVWGPHTVGSLRNFKGRRDQIAIAVHLWRMKHYTATFDIPLKLRAEVVEAWKQEAIQQIVDGAQAKYYEQRQNLKNRLNELQDALESSDGLSLRKMEREEIMKAVLRWFGFPSLAFHPLGMPENYNTGDEVNPVFNKDTGLLVNPLYVDNQRLHGQLVRYLHNAIEWENVIYFLYPYFWSPASGWSDKVDLRHPDSEHEAFLKSGVARVVLTIRPDFERSFISFLTSGSISDDVPAPYVTIADEIQNHARTSYKGIPNANPPKNTRELISKRDRECWEHMVKIMEALERYKNINSTYPSRLEDADVIGDRLLDPWGKRYQYNFPGEYGDYDLYSFGKDHATQHSKGCAAISSWAEASIIARWVEYTPTDATDLELVTPEGKATQVQDDQSVFCPARSSFSWVTIFSILCVIFFIMVLIAIFYFNSNP